ncbi:MAG: hypothetical protein DHS20C13_17870 [Thermodesulfobacteriota bacterium]|nr:MAG: hypothetical protein DHS20C13_17870 [Thermodesulfobacteriota bacterium]
MKLKFSRIKKCYEYKFKSNNFSKTSTTATSGINPGTAAVLKVNSDEHTRIKRLFGRAVNRKSNFRRV